LSADFQKSLKNQDIEDESKTYPQTDVHSHIKQLNNEETIESSQIQEIQVSSQPNSQDSHSQGKDRKESQERNLKTIYSSDGKNS